MAAEIPESGWTPDRLSARWLLALAARLMREVDALVASADATSGRVATLALDGTVRFASAADRAAFADRLAAAVTDLIARYHDETGREHRVIVAVHPSFDAKVNKVNKDDKEN